MGYAVMNIFDFRDALTHDYAEYVRSFIRVGTDDVRGTVDEALDNQLLWPEPIVQLNPAFKPGGYVRDLVRDGNVRTLARPTGAGTPTSRVMDHLPPDMTDLGLNLSARHVVNPHVDTA
jgi:hypothetical protein